MCVCACVRVCMRVCVGGGGVSGRGGLDVGMHVYTYLSTSECLAMMLASIFFLLQITVLS